MTTTTSYGTWANHGSEIDLETNVTVALGDAVDDFDVEGLVWAYREAINEGLAEHGIRLAGSEFYGPVPDIAPDVAIESAIEAVDFWALAAEFDKS